MPKATSLMYHDVLDGDVDLSGFRGAAAARYKLSRELFAKHLAKIAAVGGRPKLAVPEQWASEQPLFLTFDDGGVSASEVIAPMLEERSWPGHFFMTTNFIGQPGFLTASQLRELAGRGHVIGSHSASHPTRMARINRRDLLEEWSSSRARLEDILGAEVRVASVPGGYYSAAVGETAAEAGFRVLFNSEPTLKLRRVSGCWLLGRFYLQRDTRAQVAEGFAASRWAPRFAQAVAWNYRKVVKAVAGDTYLKLWRHILEQGK